MSDEQTVTITQSEYDRLLEDSFFLDALRRAGVDNWDGYEVAQELARETVEDDE